MKLRIIRKLSAIYLIVISICHIYATYTGLYLLGENYLANLMFRIILGNDTYTVLAYLTYFGFMALWAVLSYRNNLNTKFTTGLLVCTVLGALWFWFMNSNYATMKGFETAIWVNMISMGINSFFALGYVVSKHD